MTRDLILSKVRFSLGVKGHEAGRARTVAERLAARARHPTPGRVAGKAVDELRATLLGYLEAQGTTVLEAATPAEVPARLAELLRRENLPARIRTGADPWLAALPWDGTPSLERRTGPADPADEVGVSRAVAAVAETGTLVLASGPDNPVTLGFLPETHIVVVSEADIVGPYEDALARIRTRFGAGRMPRTVNMVTGASRTADIGGHIVKGAHGPRRLAVILVKG